MSNSTPPILIQARMGSSRLPGKMMLEINGTPIIDHVITGALQSKLSSNVILCTSTNIENDPLVERAKELGADVSRSEDEDNVLKRFLEAIEERKVEHIVRVCADNPFLSGELIDEVISEQVNHKRDYSFNHVPKFDNNYPDGLGAEVYSISLLREIAEENSKMYSEHLTLYVWDKIKELNIGLITAGKEISFPNIKLDIDTSEDFQRVSRFANFCLENSVKFYDSKSVCAAYNDFFSSNESSS